MIEINVAERARAALLAAAIADVRCTQHRQDLQPELFRAAPRLSDETWLMLATCESVARTGGTLRADVMAGVLQEWAALDRLRPPERMHGNDLSLRLAPLGFVLNPDDGADRLLLRDALAAFGAGAADARAADVLTVVRRRIVASRLLTEPAPVFSEPSLVRALGYISAGAGDLEGTLSSALDNASETVEWSRAVILAGFLVGAAGSDVPRGLVEEVPDLDAIEAIIEPFAQLVAAAGA